MYLDKLPEYWREIELGEIATLKGGGTPSRNKPAYFSGEFPWLTGYDLPDDEITLIHEGREFITQEAITESATNLVPPQTILITSRVTVGKVAIAQIPLCFSQDLTGITIFESLQEVIDPNYLAYYLLANKQRILRFDRGTTISGIRRQDLAHLKVLLPPLPEQQHIVEILRLADELRQQQRQALQKAQKLIPAIFHEMFGELNIHHELPKGWYRETLGKRIVDTQYGLSESLSETGEVAVLRMNNITYLGQLDLTDLKFLPKSAVNLRKYDLQAGDILFNRTNSADLVGKTGLWKNSKGHFTFASYLIRVRVDNQVTPEYIWGILNSGYGKYQISRLAKRAVSMANINTNELASIQIFTPPYDMQVRFAKLVTECELQVQRLATKLSGIRDLFDSLLLQAFTGELTQSYRNHNQDLLEKATVERDLMLAQKQTKIRGTIEIQLSDASLTSLTNVSKDIRESLKRNLSKTQKMVLETIQTIEERYFVPAKVKEHNNLKELSLNAVSRTFELFEKMGILMRVSLPVTPAGREYAYYETFFRLPTPADQGLEPVSENIV